MRPILPALLLACCLAPFGVAAQESSAQESNAPESTAAIADPSAETGSTAPAKPQSIAVMVDGEARSWAPLEKGTDQAWAAYLSGDYPKAVPVFERLAEIGHPVGEWLMGNVYFFGQGRPRDFARAQKMFEAAADQGYFAAYAPTAQMYEQGLGTPLDPAKAYYWYNIAAAQLRDSVERTDMVKRRETVAALLTPAQVEAAQKRANAFKPKPVVPPDPEDVDWLQD